jgi:hypothetical protein
MAATRELLFPRSAVHHHRTVAFPDLSLSLSGNKRLIISEQLDAMWFSVSGRCASAAARKQSNQHSRRLLSSGAKVWIDKDTRVICQGFTGKQVKE